MKTFPTCLIAAIACLCLVQTRAQPAYSWTTIIDTNSADLRAPTGIALDKLGNLYVLDSGSCTLLKFVLTGSHWVGSAIAGAYGTPGSTDGTKSDIRFALPTVQGFGGIALGPTGDIYVADEGNSTIRRLTQSGTNWVSATIGGLAENPGFADGTNSDARFAHATGVTVDGNGTVYVADSQNFGIRRIVQDGTNWVTTTLASGPGNVDGTNASIRFWAPWGIALDANSSLYIADSDNNSIRKLVELGTDWVCHTIAGQPDSFLLYGTQDGTNSDIRFGFLNLGPRGLTLDNSGNVFVADTGNGTIRLLRQIGTDWVSSTIAGVGVPYAGGHVDGIGTTARFDYPSGIVVDSNGNVYVADSNNSAIRMGRPLRVLTMRTADHLVCSWPTAFSNFVLETSASLAPGAAWTALTNGIAVSDDSFLVTNRIDNPATFFRLRQQ